MPKAIDDVLKDTYSTDPRTRKNAARELCPCEVKFYSRVVWDRLLELTQDQDSEVRRNVLHSLIDGSPREREPDVVAALEGLRNDPNVKLRRHARKLLARYRRTGRINSDAH